MSTFLKREDLNSFIKENLLGCKRIFGEPDHVYFARKERFLNNTMRIASCCKSAQESLQHIEETKTHIKEITANYPELSLPEIEEPLPINNFYDIEAWENFAMECSCREVEIKFICRNIENTLRSLIFVSALHNLPWTCKVVLFKSDYVPNEKEQESIQSQIKAMADIDFSGDPIFCTDYNWVAIRIGRLDTKGILKILSLIPVNANIQYI